ncbi:hypothetical protein QTN25_006026 [Entamoeba marina]
MSIIPIAPSKKKNQSSSFAKKKMSSETSQLFRCYSFVKFLFESHGWSFEIGDKMRKAPKGTSYYPILKIYDEYLSLMYDEDNIKISNTHSKHVYCKRYVLDFLIKVLKAKKYKFKERPTKPSTCRYGDNKEYGPITIKKIISFTVDSNTYIMEEVEKFVGAGTCEQLKNYFNNDSHPKKTILCPVLQQYQFIPLILQNTDFAEYLSINPNNIQDVFIPLDHQISLTNQQNVVVAESCQTHQQYEQQYDQQEVLSGCNEFINDPSLNEGNLQGYFVGQNVESGTCSQCLNNNIILNINSNSVNTMQSNNNYYLKDTPSPHALTEAENNVSSFLPYYIYEEIGDAYGLTFKQFVYPNMF